MNRYLEQFFSLRCAGDVLNVVAPLHRPSKEITEAMAAVARLKAFFLDRPMQRDLVDLCAGNALTSILAVHLLPVSEAIAVDKAPRDRPGYVNVKRWRVQRADIYEPLTHDAECAVVAVHACGNLATRIIALYRSWPSARHLVMIPCCHGDQQPRKVIPQVIREKISKYEAWAWWLAEQAEGDFYIDRAMLSPCNAVIVARKGE